MKLILLILLLPIASFCQDSTFAKWMIGDTTYVYISSTNSQYGYVDYVGSWSVLIDSSGYEIEGDTAKAVQWLLSVVNQRDSIIGEYEKFVRASVDFSNVVPDYWKTSKNNPFWKKYYARLRKNNYFLHSINNQK